MKYQTGDLKNNDVELIGWIRRCKNKRLHRAIYGIRKGSIYNTCPKIGM